MQNFDAVVCRYQLIATGIIVTTLALDNMLHGRQQRLSTEHTKSTQQDPHTPPLIFIQ